MLVHIVDQIFFAAVQRSEILKIVNCACFFIPMHLTSIKELLCLL